MSSQNPDSLEKFIHETLRDVPLRRAPRSLESRVMAAIAQRAALPWYRQSFAHWPVAARLTFLVVSAAVAALVFMLGVEILRGGVGQGWASGLHNVQECGRGLKVAGEALVGLLPPQSLYWLGAAGAGILFSYVALIGFGTAAYRFFWKTR